MTHDTSTRASDDDRQGRLRTLFLAILTAVVLMAVLRAAASIAVPVVVSVFLALLVHPIDHAVSSRVPRGTGWLGHVAGMASILVILGALTAAVWVAAAQLVGGIPTGDDSAPAELLDSAVSALLQGQGGSGGSDAGPPASDPPELPASLRDALGGLGQQALETGLGWATGFARTILAAAGGLSSGLVLVFFLTLLMLIEAGQWRNKVAAALPARADRSALDAVTAIAARLRRYLVARTVLGVLTAAAYTGWLWFSGIDLLIVWAVLAFALNYIPTLGSIISGAVPVAYAFLTRDPATALLAAAGILAIEQVIGNFIDPRVQGRTVSLSPLVVLVALLVWAWMWGVAGMLLAVPMTIAALVICAHVPALRPVALALSSEADFDGLDRVVRP